MSIHEIMKELRTQHQYTQQYVANFLQIDRSNYSKYENGKLEINIDILKKLCCLYNVSADYILGLKDI